MWYKKIISTILFILIIFLVIVFPGEAKKPVQKPEKHGNTESNILNDGLAVESQGVIYYASNSGIWRINNDNTAKTLVCKDEASYLNVMDGWIYYKDSKEKGIFKIKIEGNQKTKICSDSVSSMNIVGTNVYYSGNSDEVLGSKPSICKIRTDGSGRTVILPSTSNRSTISYFNAEEDKIYYTSSSNLTEINLEGTKKLFMAPENVDRFAVSGEWIYYYAYRMFQKDALFRINIDGSKKSIILEDANCFNINGNSIYYEKLLKKAETKKTSNSFSIDFDGKKLMSINKRNTDGTNDTKLIDAEAMSINVAGDWIFYTIRDKGDNEEKLFKVKTDGTEKQQVE